MPTKRSPSAIDFMRQYKPKQNGLGEGLSKFPFDRNIQKKIRKLDNEIKLKKLIEERKKSKQKRRKKQNYKDGGLAVRGTGAQVKKTTFKGVF